MKLLLHPAVEAARFEKIVEAAGPMKVVNAASEAEALREIADADGFFGKMTPPLLTAARKLRWLQTPTASLEHYIFPDLVSHPCLLTNMRGLFSDNIADQVMGYVLCFARNLHRYVLQQAQARWSPIGGERERVDFVMGPAYVSGIDRAHLHLPDLTMGIVGLGAIGAEIARRALAFNMKVVAVDAMRKEPPPGVAAVLPVEQLPQLLAESDFVVIAAPHTPKTAKLFRRELFQKMRRNAYLINIGRGAIVDLTDLAASIQAGEIAGAALDVFETEPLPANHPLWRMGEKVILTPHVAGYSPHIAARHLALLLDNVRRFAAGDPLRNIVNKTEWF